VTCLIDDVTCLIDDVTCLIDDVYRVFTVSLRDVTELIVNIRLF